jgi:copper(I)-binding protein
VNGGTANVSRALQDSTRRPRSVAASVAAGLVAVLALAGCGSGQNTQTDSVEPAVNGMLGQVGPILIRDAEFAYPDGGSYPSGGAAPLVLTIINTGSTDDELVEVSSPVAATVEVQGDRSLPARGSIQVGSPDKVVSPTTTTTTTTTTAPSTTSGSPSATVSASSSSSAPSSVSPGPSGPPTVIGSGTIVLTGLNDTLNAGKTYPVTLVFRNAGSITLTLPVATPTTARPEPTSQKASG